MVAVLDDTLSGEEDETVMTSLEGRLSDAAMGLIRRAAPMNLEEAQVASWAWRLTTGTDTTYAERFLDIVEVVGVASK